MPRSLPLGCLVVGLVMVGTPSSWAQNTTTQTPPASPTYQRQLAGQRAFGRPFFQQPFVFQQPATQGFTFQRPYPYHLDYYRQRYGGGYQPYFGNLYGPPQIVGTQPFAFSGYPQNQPDLNQPATNHAPPASIACPHCRQPVPLPYATPPTTP